MTAKQITMCRRYRNDAVKAGRVNESQFNRMVLILMREGWDGDTLNWSSAALIARNTATAHLRVQLTGIPELLRRVGVCK